MTSIYYKEFWLVISFILLSLFLLESSRSAKLYGTILGRLLLVIIIIMASIYDFTFGILTVTVIILGFKNYYGEVKYGIESFTDNLFQKEEKKEEVGTKKDSDTYIKEETGVEISNINNLVDYTHLEENIRPKDSGSIEPLLNNSSEEVEPTSVENFTSHPSVHSYEDI